MWLMGRDACAHKINRIFNLVFSYLPKSKHSLHTKRRMKRNGGQPNSYNMQLKLLEPFDSNDLVAMLIQDGPRLDDRTGWASMYMASIADEMNWDEHLLGARRTC